jgi:predicted acetyltransferase
VQRDYDYSVLQTQDEAQQFSEILAQSFVVSAEQELTYLQQIGYDNCRIIRQGHQVLGGLALFSMGQWFGGRRVPMTGIGSVAMAPEARGQGAATFLMEATVGELAAQGVALSTLYPAVKALYHKAGYGQGGTYCRWQVEAAAIQAKAPSLAIHGLPVDPDRPLWHSGQSHFSQAHDGGLDRHPYLWQRIFQRRDESPVYAYGFGDQADPQGYIIYNQQRHPQGTTLVIRDWYANSAIALNSIWGFLSSHRSQIDRISWSGGAIDPLVLALPEPTATITSMEQWMVRLCDLKALAQRGYPPEITADLHLEVQDPMVQGNSGKFVLAVDNQQGALQPGGRGDLQISIQALAPLFTGLYSAQALAQMGYLTAAPETAALATALFSGGSPFMKDFF